MKSCITNRRWSKLFVPLVGGENPEHIASAGFGQLPTNRVSPWIRPISTACVRGPPVCRVNPIHTPPAARNIGSGNRAGNRWTSRSVHTLGSAERMLEGLAFLRAKADRSTRPRQTELAGYW